MMNMCEHWYISVRTYYTYSDTTTLYDVLPIDTICNTFQYMVVQHDWDLVYAWDSISLSVAGV